MVAGTCTPGLGHSSKMLLREHRGHPDCPARGVSEYSPPQCHHMFHCNWNIALMKPRLCLAVGRRRSQFCVFERKKSSSNLLISMIKNLFFVSLWQVRPSSLKFIIAGALFLPWCLKFKFNFSYDIIGPCQPAYHEHQNCPRIWDESYCLTTCL